MAERYEPNSFEAKWRQRWKEADLFRTREDPGREKFYGMDFFPYPSGAGLSVGHCRNFIPTDVICRVKYMQGFNVLHPMGFDAFGLPAENEAIKRKTHPAKMIEEYAANYRRQMDLVGISYDWSRSFKSSDPDYYRWTQWIFELLYKKGLAYRKLASVNWCPKDKTALANEEVVAGLCERCGTPVEKRSIPQWFFRITAYAERLLADLDTVDWPEGIKALQRNWIGKSEGVEFSLKVASSAFSRSEKGEGVGGEGSGADLHPPTPLLLPGKEEGGLEVLSGKRELHFRVFTTRVDTVFGMTFCVLAPEHALVENLLGVVDEAHREAIRAYRDRAKALSEAERLAANREKTGVFTGAYAVNPANGERVPIWVADYALATYGTGALMAVPAHDDRDFEFATKFGLDVRRVIAPSHLKGEGSGADLHPPAPLLLPGKEEGELPPLPWTDKSDAILVNSGEYDGMPVKEAQTKLGEWMEALGIGERKIQYKLRDWLISRQRYWGCPIPIIHNAEGDMSLVPEDCLPVELPEVENYEPAGDGSSPLAQIPEFLNVTDSDGRLGRRETDTMGGFACSSWYFLRFCDPHNHEQGWSADAVKYWMPVDCYVGGAEHAVMHLFYARFWTKVLFDEGLVPVQEPFQVLRNQGQVLGKTPYRRPRQGEKLDFGEDTIMMSFEEAAEMPEDEVIWRWVRMSKSKGNVVTPDEAVEQYGADALRIYELFVAPFEADVQWSNDGMNGARKFLTRVFRIADDLSVLFRPLTPAQEQALPSLQTNAQDTSMLASQLRRKLHQTIRACNEDIEQFGFNTYVSTLMKALNSFEEVCIDVARSQHSTQPAGDWASYMKTWRQNGYIVADDKTKGVLKQTLETFILLLAPAAPHTADELWESLGKSGFTYEQTWPTWDPELARSDTVTIAVQVNGKLRDTLEMPAGATNEELQAAGLASPKVAVHIEGKTIRKIIVVPGKLVNVVVG